MQLQGTLNGVKLTLLAEPCPYQLCRRLVTQFFNAMVGLTAATVERYSLQIDSE